MVHEGTQPNTSRGGHLRRVGMRGVLWRRVAVVLAAAVGLAGAPLAGASAHPLHHAVVAARVTGATPPSVKVIVQKVDGAGHGPEAAIAHLGGAVTRDLPIVNGFAATVPVGGVGRLSGLSGVKAVTLDATLP